MHFHGKDKEQLSKERECGVPVIRNLQHSTDTIGINEFGYLKEC